MRAVVVDADLVEHLDIGAAGARGGEVDAEIVDRLFHAGLDEVLSVSLSAGIADIAETAMEIL